jgi:hypothetical protein
VLCRQATAFSTGTIKRRASGKRRRKKSEPIPIYEHASFFLFSSLLTSRKSSSPKMERDDEYFLDVSSVCHSLIVAGCPTGWGFTPAEQHKVRQQNITIFRVVPLIAVCQHTHTQISK